MIRSGLNSFCVLSYSTPSFYGRQDVHTSLIQFLSTAFTVSLIYSETSPSDVLSKSQSSTKEKPSVAARRALTKVVTHVAEKHLVLCYDCSHRTHTIHWC
jgi:hypothetical protein